MKRSQSPGLAGPIVTGPLWLPLLLYLIGSTLSAHESRTYPRHTMSPASLASELQRQTSEHQSFIEGNYDSVPVIARVWNPPTLSYELRPTMKWVRRDPLTT